MRKADYERLADTGCPKIPKGWRRVRAGATRMGDKYWAYHFGGKRAWALFSPGWVGINAAHFKYVIRRKEER